MPEDRFGDLGEGRESAGERFADLDRTHPEEPDRKPPRARPPGRSYAWVVGVAAVIAITVAGVNSLPNAGRGSSGPQDGKPMPRFAAPSAAGQLDGDPNIKQSKNDDAAPNDTPACEVTLKGSLRSCDYTNKPVVLTFIVPGAKDCEEFLDRVQRVKGRYPEVNFIAVVSGRERDTVKELVDKRGWTFPVFVDRNLSIFNTYRVSVCATAVFAYRGGTVRMSEVEAQHWTDRELETAIKGIRSR